VLGCLLLIAGCGEPMAEVSGTVFLDEQPLSEGDIIFEEVDRSKTPVGGKIVDGRYSVRMLPGSKVVKISASRPARKPDPVMGTAAREALIAEEFNEHSTLRADITPGLREGLNFKVSAIP
jgi:hypothetical protein